MAYALFSDYPIWEVPKTLLPSSWSPYVLVIGLLTLCLLVSVLSSAIYNIFFHPLAKYPGPSLAAATRLVFVYFFVKGDAVAWVDRLHAKYGEVVRVEPGRLSYITPEAWKDIYGHQTATRKANSKAASDIFANKSFSISTAPGGTEHSRQRKIFSNAFSDRAIRLQEPMLLQYADQLVRLVRRQISGAGVDKDIITVNAVSLFNFATFDIMADLAFGESLGCLEKGVYHSWVEAVMVNFKGMMIKAILRSHPILSFIWRLSQPQQDKEMAARHVQSSRDRVSRRLEKGAEARPDIWGLVLKANGPNALNRVEMDNNANTL